MHGATIKTTIFCLR